MELIKETAKIFKNFLNERSKLKRYNRPTFSTNSEPFSTKFPTLGNNEQLPCLKSYQCF